MQPRPKPHPDQVRDVAYLKHDSHWSEEIYVHWSVDAFCCTTNVIWECLRLISHLCPSLLCKGESRRQLKVSLECLAVPKGVETLSVGQNPAKTLD
ncbi:MAG: hypothetical protein AAFY26_17975, partial [Cyanobacteria bacterium J06638_22]